MFPENKENKIVRSTTILCLRGKRKVVFASDGQVSMGNTVLKSNACKLRRLGRERNVVVGFAGTTSGAFSLFEKLEHKLEKHPSNLRLACVELAKSWRNDEYFRRVEAMMIVANSKETYLLTGTGDVIDPEFSSVAIGSGGPYAFASSQALMGNTKLSLKEIAKISMEIAASICVYTNCYISFEEIDIPNDD